MFKVGLVLIYRQYKILRWLSVVLHFLYLTDFYWNPGTWKSRFENQNHLFIVTRAEVNPEWHIYGENVNIAAILTHWGRVTHICVSELTIIGSDNGLSPGRHQAIIWTNAGIVLIRTPGTNFSEILGKTHSFSFKKMHLKMSSAKGRLFSLGLNELIAGRSAETCMWVGRWVSSWRPLFPSRNAVLIYILIYTFVFFIRVLVIRRTYIYIHRECRPVQYWWRCTPSQSIGLLFWECVVPVLNATCCFLWFHQMFLALW